jgi:formamidopyrimidine-DNA glycosylase
MPESPDLEVYSKNLNANYAGRRLNDIVVVNVKGVKDDAALLNRAIKGQILEKVYRAGKELRFAFSNKTILGMHLMLHGKLYAFDTGNDQNHSLVEFHFEGKGLVMTDYQRSANIKLNPQEKEGIDALARGLNFNYLKKALQSKSTIKTRITNQDVIRGIGNAYADEILWEAKIDPRSISNKIPDEKIKALAKAIRSVLVEAKKEIIKTDPGIISGEVRHFLKIHNAKRQKSPGGAVIKVEKKGGSTYYTDEQELFI